jgi:CRISPR-associated endoribonuclease Cas6
MPYSLVLNLVPRSPIPISNLSGRHLHALFLDLVSSVNRELATQLHHQTTDKAFTLSPLQVKSRGKFEDGDLQWQHPKAIAAGTPFWWRISLLDEALFSQLAHLWLSISPAQSWHLGPADLQVANILGTSNSEQPWANFCSYEQIFQQASKEQRQIRFRFYTPTTFRISDYDCALPTRELVFNSLLKRWNRYSNMPFDFTLTEAIYPSYFDIRTEMVMDSRSKLIGCMGLVTYQILGTVTPLMIQQINALADFAMYAGVGRKTPMGMGMVRRLNNKSK